MRGRCADRSEATHRVADQHEGPAAETVEHPGEQRRIAERCRVALDGAVAPPGPIDGMHGVGGCDLFDDSVEVVMVSAVRVEQDYRWPCAGRVNGNPFDHVFRCGHAQSIHDRTVSYSWVAVK
jgi:hypothetical protein